MELPSYSQQLLLQLYALCKEQRFCDCTISVGNIYFRAHKPVLAAASLLFKTLLDSTDAISIDASVVSPEEFALLLEMTYTGKLPVGKHNFSKIISLADSLQMFDVAVSCKNLLTNLVNCSVQGQVVRDVSVLSSEAGNKESEKPQVEALSSEGAEEPSSSPEVSAVPAGPEKAKTQDVINIATQEINADPPVAQEVQVAAEITGATPHTAEVCSPSPVGQIPSETKEVNTEAECETKQDQLTLLLEHESVFSDAALLTPDTLRRLAGCSEIEGPQKETIIECLTSEGGSSAFQRILDKVHDGSLDVQVALSLVRLYQESTPAEKVSQIQPEGSAGEGKTLSVLLLEHKEDLIQCVTQLRPIVEFLETAKEEFLPDSEKRVIQSCCEGRTPKEMIENLLHRVTEEKTLPAKSLVKLLQAVRTAFPNLDLLLDNLQKGAGSAGTTGLARVSCESEWTDEPRPVCIPADRVDGSSPSPDAYGAELLRKYHENLSEILIDNQVLLKVISRMQSLAPGDREVMQTLVKQGSGSGGFSSLMLAALERQTLSATAIWQLLLAVEETETRPLNLLLEEVGKEPGAGAFFRAVTAPESTVLEAILRHSKLLREAIQQTAGCERLSSEEEHLAETVQEMLSISSETVSPEASLRAVLSKAMEKSVSASVVCHLLCSVHKSFPGLQPLMQELAHVGFLTKESGEERWKVTDGLHPGAKDKVEEVAKATGEDCQANEQKEQGEPGPVPEQPEKDTSASPDSAKKSFVCKACDKSFHFYCRLKVHMKRCRVAKSRQVQSEEGSETKGSEKGLEKQQPDARGTGGEPDAPKKKKKRLPVTCDLCGREFAHASGMQYHKLTEHFDEKPFSCEECGAKFAANSTLKNHLRLHTGDRPFMCKHCLMTFTQASALAYHTKKKHSEGKMYACQYCDAVFAQSIELSRHVRTHTGDKPYVCRDCGKGFRQANGLSIHLHTFHNIEDPYDCKKCRMSFSTLQDHRKHIHEVHAKEYHPCPTCGKIFSAPSMLERHMVTHVGGKPFSCGICNKAYQQLSGLWYHNRTHHPDVFAAQNHRSPKFSSLQCSSCDKTFSNTVEHKKHIKTEHTDVKFHECDQCKELFPTPALLQVHVKCQHSVNLLDTSTIHGDWGWLTYPAHGWDSINEVDESFRPIHTYQVCNVMSPNQNNWLRTNWVPRDGARRVYAEIKFTLRDCNSIPGVLGTCKETFNLHYLESDRDLGASTQESQFLKIDTIAADESFTGADLGVRRLKLNTEVRGVGPLSKRGFYLAFQDIGACLAILSLRIYYKKCPAMVRNLAAFSEAVTGADSSSLVEVRGQCVRHSEERDTPKMYCSAEGEWLVPIGKCVCSAGYEERRDACMACELGFYKSAPGDQLCARCPPHSHSATPAAQTCRCDLSYYRAALDPPSAACTRPPSAPVNLISSVNGTSVTLEWAPPLDPGGRSDITYNAVCRRCPWALSHCEACGSGTRFVPQQTSLAQASLLVANLLAHMNYSFWIEAVNGVSNLSPEPRSAAVVNITTNQAAPSQVVVIRQERAGQTSVSLLWQEPEQPNGIILEYEIKYYEKDKEMQSYSTLKAVTTRATVSGLKPGTRYVFQVRARTSAGCGRFSQAMEVETGKPRPRYDTRTIVWICLTLITGLVVLLLLLICKKRHCGYSKAFQDSDEEKMHYQNGQAPPPVFLPLNHPPGKFPETQFSAEPHTYEEPGRAGRSFTREIEASRIHIEKIIGSGESGEVCYGRLQVPGQRDVPVAIKALKAGYTERQRQDFLSEAAIMGQFDHPNIIRLEGVVTRGRLAMIVTEYMENGSLDAFLRTHDGQFTIVQLVGMLRGVGAGMRYLSDLGYIHRDLAARNVLVDGRLVCKVSDFGLSRALEDDPEAAYTTAGGKIPIRWTAPEAIAFRTFSSASDVWSFGVVMWEVLAYGERPYWNMTNQDVISSVEEGYRLPAPMGCPRALHQLMLDCWHKDRAQRPRFAHVVSVLDALVHSPESLRATATVSRCPPPAFARSCFDLRAGGSGNGDLTVGDWLDSIRMGRYRDHFAAGGYSSLGMVLRMNAQDVRALGITLMGHQKKILGSIQTMRAQLSSTQGPRRHL